MSMMAEMQPAPLRLEPDERTPTGPFIVPPDRSALIGRTEEADIHLPDPSVSRRHARLVAHDRRWFVRDLASRHGTYLNSIRLEPNVEAALANRDLLRVGPWTLQVMLAEPEGAAPAPEFTAHPSSHDSGSAPSAGNGYATRASIFLRLRDDRHDVRQLSWQEFADRYGPLIVAFARHAGLPPQEADDVLQDVLLGFFRVSGNFEYDPSKGRFRGYLKRITLNAVRMRHRRQRPEVIPDNEQLAQYPDRADTIWNREWTRSVLGRALAEAEPQFEPQTWKAFDLYGRRGVHHEEAARQLGMTPEGVRQAKCRVAAKVREITERIRAEEG
jgi:RNA polymerase sigma-70 factor (ECF subfamily)